MVGRDHVRGQSLSQVGLAWNDEKHLDGWVVVLYVFKIMRDPASTTQRLVAAAHRVRHSREIHGLRHEQRKKAYSVSREEACYCLGL